MALAQAAVSRTVPTENRGLFDILHATVFVFVDTSCLHMMPKLVNGFEPTAWSHQRKHRDRTTSWQGSASTQLQFIMSIHKQLVQVLTTIRNISQNMAQRCTTKLCLFRSKSREARSCRRCQSNCVISPLLGQSLPQWVLNAKAHGNKHVALQRIPRIISHSSVPSRTLTNRLISNHGVDDLIEQSSVLITFFWNKKSIPTKLTRLDLLQDICLHLSKVTQSSYFYLEEAVIEVVVSVTPLNICGTPKRHLSRTQIDPGGKDVWLDSMMRPQLLHLWWGESYPQTNTILHWVQTEIASQTQQRKWLRDTDALHVDWHSLQIYVDADL